MRKKTKCGKSMGEENRMADYSCYSFEATGEQIEAMGKWKYLALHHELTDLPNRRMLHMSMESYMARAHQQQTKLAVVLIDIDQFKEINDMFGHYAGDEFLIEMSNRLAALSEHHIQAFHLSGDEFMLLIELADNLKEKMERVTAVFDTPFQMDQNRILVSASIGVSLYPDQSIDAEKLIYYADKAMYRAKSSVENRCRVFRPGMDE
ncbi:GGDEF domain-containing protein [Bacillus sp. 37MA]|uniref:GGDEF domain-containing protein n=1 Tax=Bacillus sp. 37MA TaxID=1132442 RepID=UPI00037A5A44|nr:GGDEF domain-containing protein [Bacillus sp. 37MA]